MPKKLIIVATHPQQDAHAKRKLKQAEEALAAPAWGNLNDKQKLETLHEAMVQLIKRLNQDMKH